MTRRTRTTVNSEKIAGRYDDVDEIFSAAGQLQFYGGGLSQLGQALYVSIIGSLTQAGATLGEGMGWRSLPHDHPAVLAAVVAIDAAEAMLGAMLKAASQP